MNDALGIGSDKLPAPQATLMATVIKGLLSQNLPWGLVLVGMGIAAVMELSGVRSLPFAVGAYLPLSVSTPIFVGGMVKYFVDTFKKGGESDSEIGPGALLSSGLIAGGALTGILYAVLVGTTFETASGETSIAEMLNSGIAESMGLEGDFISVVIFLAMAAVLFKFAMGKEEKLEK